MNEPIVEIRNFLRTRLTDPNSGRDTPNYVYTWWPRHDLTVDSFPLVTVVQLDESSEVFGLGSTVHWATFPIQIDIWAKEDKLYTVDAVAREGKELAFIIARKIQEAFRLYWISDLAQTGKFKLYKLSGKKPVAYDFERKLWRITITIELERDLGTNWI